jgi:dihydroflavonol-4-reductase
MSFVEPTQPITTRPVLLTGISGFIGIHVARTLMAHGYSVRGSLRSLERADAVRRALEESGQDGQRVEFVRLDMTRDEGFGEALRGIEYVIHVASPIPSHPPRDENELIVPARDGTLRVLRAASEHGARRVIVTSSISAVYSGHPRDGSHVFTEADFSRLDAPITAYDKSKTIAELGAWDFVHSLPADKRLELVTVNPGFVLGPILERDPGISNELILKLVRRQMPALPDLNFAPVDVRDVAELHYRAMVTPDASGQRVCCALPNMHLSEFAAILVKAGHRVPTRRLPNVLVRVLALFDRKVALLVGDLGQRLDVDSTRARTLLGWEPRAIETTVLDAVESFRRHGLI